MKSIRRAVVLLSTATAVVFGGMLPADAQFSNSASAPTMAITAVDVLAPTGVSTAGTKCVTVWDPNTASWKSVLQAQVDWNASSSRGVTGYVVTAYFTDGTRYPVAQTNAATTSLSGTYDVYYASQNVRVTITTLTSYGWTEESAQSGAIKC
jgi:hypothetical protein